MARVGLPAPSPSHCAHNFGRYITAILGLEAEIELSHGSKKAVIRGYIQSAEEEQEEEQDIHVPLIPLQLYIRGARQLNGAVR